MGYPQNKKLDFDKHSAPVPDIIGCFRNVLGTLYKELFKIVPKTLLKRA
jgi:hypothetical protein